MKKIILDTNIVSTFLKINEMSLLQSLFPNHSYAITTGISEELRAAGFDTGHFAIIQLSKEEIHQKEGLARRYGSLGKGELECVTLCLSRSITMLTNDRRAKNIALEQGIICFDLSEILFALRLKGFINRDRLKKIVYAIESKDNVVFKNVERLYR